MSQIGVIAPASVIGQVELDLGVEKLRSEGFDVEVHEQVRKQHLFYAGTDEQRAQAFADYAYSDSVSVIWAARGGYGSNRLLRELLRLTKGREKPPTNKLLVGFSDVTLLLEFVANEWGWSVMHAPMVAGREFTLLEPYEWQALTKWVQKKETSFPWSRSPLRFIGDAPKAPVEGRLRGGNLKVWEAMQGTSVSPRMAAGDLLFFEEISETPSKIDRILEQLDQSGGFEGVGTIILGEFIGCEDRVSTVLRRAPSRPDDLRNPPEDNLRPLRDLISTRRALDSIFGELGSRLGIPVATGLPVGHGRRNSPLPLHASYRLTSSGVLELTNWSWLCATK